MHITDFKNYCKKPGIVYVIDMTGSCKMKSHPIKIGGGDSPARTVDSMKAKSQGIDPDGQVLAVFYSFAWKADEEKMHNAFNDKRYRDKQPGKRTRKLELFALTVNDLPGIVAQAKGIGLIPIFITPEHSHLEVTLPKVRIPETKSNVAPTVNHKELFTRPVVLRSSVEATVVQEREIGRPLQRSISIVPGSSGPKLEVANGPSLFTNPLRKNHGH